MLFQGRSILTAKMKKTRMCDFHKEGRRDLAATAQHPSTPWFPGVNMEKTALLHTMSILAAESCRLAAAHAELTLNEGIFATFL